MITSGGGFSERNSLPSFQSAAVAQYLSQVAGSNKAPASGYAASGRAYPDISAIMGYNYPVILNNQKYLAAGTSAWYHW